MMSKNGVRREGVSVALTVQKYNREIALYECSWKFFSGDEKFFLPQKNVVNKSIGQ